MTTKQVRNYSDDSQENFGGSQLLVYFCILHTSVCLSHQYTTIILMLASIIGNIATYVHRIFSINIHRPDHHNKALCMCNIVTNTVGNFFSRTCGHYLLLINNFHPKWRHRIFFLQNFLQRCECIIFWKIILWFRNLHKFCWKNCPMCSSSICTSILYGVVSSNDLVNIWF